MHPLTQGVLLGLVAVAAVYDYFQRRIPNWTVAAGMIAALSLDAALGLWRDSLLGMGLALAVYLPFYLLRAMGAGDVKLMLAVGALTGPSHWLGIFVITSVLGGAVALVVLISRGRLGHALSNIGIILRRLARLQAPAEASPELDVRSAQSVKLPHGVVIAFGTLIYVLLIR